MAKKPSYWSLADVTELKQLTAQLTEIVKDTEMSDYERVAIMLNANHNMSRLAAVVLSRHM